MIISTFEGPYAACQGKEIIFDSYWNKVNQAVYPMAQFATTTIQTSLRSTIITNIQWIMTPHTNFIDLNCDYFNSKIQYNQTVLIKNCLLTDSPQQLSAILYGFIPGSSRYLIINF